MRLLEGGKKLLHFPCLFQSFVGLLRKKLVVRLVTGGGGGWRSSPVRPALVGGRRLVDYNLRGVCSEGLEDLEVGGRS